MARIAKALDIVVGGAGGISTWRDVEYVMGGAHHVEICTTFFLEGPEVFKRMVLGLNEFMERKGVKNFHDMGGWLQRN